MAKKIGFVIVLTVLLTLTLSGCKRPASQAPIDEVKTTPILIQTEDAEGGQQPEGEDEKALETATLELIATLTPTPEPTEVIVIPTMTVPTEYTVKAGELVFCLARRFDVDPNDIISLNGLSADGALSVGDVLQIPQSGSWTLGDRNLIEHPTTYTVQAGETIYTIACKFGDVYPEEIIAANRLEEPYEVTAGQTLQIP